MQLNLGINMVVICQCHVACQERFVNFTLNTVFVT